MQKKSKKTLFSLLFGFLLSLNLTTKSQTFDTICNWDGISREWEVSTGNSAVVNNPSPDAVNTSEHCFKFVTGSGMYDYMKSLMDGPANFDYRPRYRLKVLAPPGGGNITLKLENHNNSFSQEIVKAAVPGQWTDIEYDFSGLVFADFIYMVIFPDFEGTSSGKIWYIDDIINEIDSVPPPLELQSDLPIIVINTFGVPIPDDPKITGHMGIIDHGPGQTNDLNDPFTNYDGYIGIETRGQSSQMFPKKSYAVETRDASGDNLDVSLLGLPEENDWVLYAPYTDKSMLRNLVSFEMGRKMDHYCSRTVFCEIVINGDYRGVYCLMEKIKGDDNRVDIASLKPGDILGDELTGGYIIKVDKIDWDFELGTDGWKSDPVPAYPDAMDIIFQYFEPKPEELMSEQKTYIRNFITNAENSLTSPYFTDPDRGYQKFFDVLSFIDFLILSEIPKEVDKYRYSTYFHKDKDSKGGKLFAGPAWDFDLGYGNVDYWEPGIQTFGWLYNTVEPYDWSIMFWWKRMMEDPYFRNLAKTRYNWLRQDKLSNENIHALVDSVLSLIDEAKDRNYERWPILGEYVWPNFDWYGNTYADEVDYFEDYLFGRLAWMDANFPGTEIGPKAGLSYKDGKLVLHLYDDYFCTAQVRKGHFTLNNIPGSVQIDNLAYWNASEVHLFLSEDPSAYPEMTVTVSEKALNYWLDITSNPLSSAGTGDLPSEPYAIRAFYKDYHLHILSGQPDELPEEAEILNMAGQSLGSIHLEKKAENITSIPLKPGIYIIRIVSAGIPCAVRFVVAQ